MTIGERIFCLRRLSIGLAHSETCWPTKSLLPSRLRKCCPNSTEQTEGKNARKVYGDSTFMKQLINGSIFHLRSAVDRLRHWLTLGLVKFVWSEAKNASNKRKHGVSFQEAKALLHLVSTT